MALTDFLTSKNNGSSAPTEHDPPWLSARYEFHGVYGNLARSRNAWMTAFFSVLALTILLAILLAVRIMTTDLVPYVIETDRFGRAHQAQVVEEMPPASEIMRQATLSNVINKLRTVTTDQALQVVMIKEAYAHLTGDALTYVNQYFQDPEHDPRLLGRDVRRTVEVNVILPVPGTDGPDADGPLYKIEWTEHTTETGRSASATSQAWQAYLRLGQHVPETAEQRRLNPLGIYVTTLRWSSITTSSTDDETNS